MSKKKKEKVPSKAQATVRVTLGRGKNKVSVDVPVVVDFKKVHVYFKQTPASAVVDEAINEVAMSNMKYEVLDKKTLVGCFNTYRKSKGV